MTVGNCDLQGSPPVLTVKAAYSKHRREDVQPIPVLFAQTLKDYLANRPADQLAFSTMPRLDSLAKMLRKDLEVAGIPYRDESGRVADFHALRHTYITNLARAGIHPKTAMDLARHSDINLTLARYSHTLVADRANALDALETSRSEDEREEKRATGTYDFSSETGGADKQHDKPDNHALQPVSTQGDTEKHDCFLNRRSQVRILPGAVLNYLGPCC